MDAEELARAERRRALARERQRRRRANAEVRAAEAQAKRQRREQDPELRQREAEAQRLRSAANPHHRAQQALAARRRREANPELRVKQAIAARQRREANPDLRVRQAIAARQRREANPELRVQQSIAARRRREAHPELRVKQAIAARRRREANPEIRVQEAIAARRRREAKLQLQLQQAIAACQRREGNLQVGQHEAQASCQERQLLETGGEGTSRERDFVVHTFGLSCKADEEFRQFVKTLSDEPGAPKLKSKSIKPSPGFCIKTKDSSNGSKLFINICHTPELPEPRDISDEELMHILGSDDPTTYRVPLSLGLPHEEVDKSGAPCTAYDVIINEAFFRKISSNELFKTFLITVALDGIEEKYKAHPERESYVVLKNKLYMGTMPDHSIQDRKGPLISELPTGQKQPTSSSGGGEGDGDESVSNSGSDDSSALSCRGSAKVDLTRHTLPGQRHTLVARFSLPAVKSGSSLALDMADDHVRLTSEEPKYTFEFYLPFSIDEGAAIAEFNTKHQVLTVTVPILPDES